MLVPKIIEFRDGIILLYNGNLKHVATKSIKEVKMAGKNIHVVHNGDQWQVKQENAQRSSGNFNTQKEAIERAREIAINNGQEVIIHGLNGRIREKNSYGNDSYPPKG
ncbi:MAG: DUF2188 domain-containing protein [Bacteroidota bacterium]